MTDIAEPNDRPGRLVRPVAAAPAAPVVTAPTDGLFETGVWYYNGEEIGTYRDQLAAQAAVRRATSSGWSSDATFDDEGDLVHFGLKQPHRVVVERRDLNGL